VSAAGRRSRASAYRFHDLRHLAASLQLASVWTSRSCPKPLGHSTYTITADTYCHRIRNVGR
jgi:integrase